MSPWCFDLEFVESDSGGCFVPFRHPGFIPTVAGLCRLPLDDFFPKNAHPIIPDSRVTPLP